MRDLKNLYEEEQRFISGMDFSKWLNNEFIPNNSDYKWIKGVSSKAVKQSIMNAEDAFNKFFYKKAGFPKFKKKQKNNTTDLTLKRHPIKIPTIGFMRFKEFGYIPIKSHISSCTVSQIADRY